MILNAHQVRCHGTPDTGARVFTPPSDRAPWQAKKKMNHVVMEVNAYRMSENRYGVCVAVHGVCAHRRALQALYGSAGGCCAADSVADQPHCDTGEWCPCRVCASA